MKIFLSQSPRGLLQYLLQTIGEIPEEKKEILLLKLNIGEEEKRKGHIGVHHACFLHWTIGHLSTAASCLQRGLLRTTWSVSIGNSFKTLKTSPGESGYKTSPANQSSLPSSLLPKLSCFSVTHISCDYHIYHSCVSVKSWLHWFTLNSMCLP